MLSQIRTHRHQLTVLPQQIQLLKLFHLTNLELQQRIQDELDDNPLLEENISNEEDRDNEPIDNIQDYQDEEEYRYDDIPDYKLEYNNYLSDHNLPQRPISEQYDFRHDLKEHAVVIFTNETELDLAFYIIDSVNECGLLEQSLDVLADDYSFNKYRVVDLSLLEKIRSVVKEFEPAGVGCFTIKEFLIFQLQKLNAPNVKKAICLLEKHIDSFSFKNTESIAKLLQIDEDKFQIVLKLIRTCKSKPITETDSTSTHATIIPDFIVRCTGDIFEISLSRQRSSSLFINQSIPARILKGGNNENSNQYLKSKLNSAQWFVDAIKQREETMQKVIQAMVELQRDYFLNGDINHLKPMILKNVADRIGVDISTVSRITCNKYVDTDFGIIHLKELFSEGLQNESGENISNRVIQSAMEEVVRNEDKKNPLSDHQLVALLSGMGFNLARRTVAKYRDQLRIPAAQLRAIWSS